MLRYWLFIMKRAPAMAWRSALHFEAFVGLFLFLAILLVPLMGGSVEQAEGVAHWVALHYKWLWIIVAMILVHVVMKAMYEQHAELLAELARYRDDLERLTAKRSQMQLEAIDFYFAFSNLASRQLVAEDDLEEWKDDMEQLQRAAHDWTALNFGEHEVKIRFNGPLPHRNFDAAINDEHGKLLSQIHEFYYPSLREFAGKNPLINRAEQ
jgi:hypothetical protein